MDNEGERVDLSDEALQADLKRLGEKNFRRKYFLHARLKIPAVNAIFDELDRDAENRKARITTWSAIITAIATLATAIGVFVVR